MGAACGHFFADVMNRSLILRTPIVMNGASAFDHYGWRSDKCVIEIIGRHASTVREGLSLRARFLTLEDHELSMVSILPHDFAVFDLSTD